MVQFAVYHALLAGYVSLMHVFPLSLLHTVHSAIHSLPFPACRVCIPDAVYYSLLAGYVCFPPEFTAWCNLQCTMPCLQGMYP